MFHSVVVNTMLGSERTLLGWVEFRSQLRRSIRRRTWPSQVLRLRRVLPIEMLLYQIVEVRLASRRGTKPSTQSMHRGDSAERRYSASGRRFVNWGVYGVDITHVVVYGQCWILRAPHLPVLVTFTKAVSTWRITQLRSLSKELSGVFIVNKYDVMYSSFVQECELVQGMRKLGSSVLGGAFEPLDTFLRSLRQAQFAVKFGNSEPVQRAGVGRSPGLAEKLYCLCRLPTTAPPVLAACPSTVCSVRVAMFGSEDKKGKGTVKVLAVLVRPDAIRVTIGQKILRGHVSAVCVPLEEGSGLLDEIFALIHSLFHIHHVGWREFGNGKRLGGVDHEDGKFELQIRILRLFSVGAVKLQCSLMGEEGGLFAGTKVGMVEDRTWCWGVGPDGLVGD